MTYIIESLIKGVWTPIDTFTSKKVAELSLAIKRSLPKHFHQPHHLRIAPKKRAKRRPTDRLEQPIAKPAKPEKQKQWKTITQRRLSEYIANSEAES